ncbi:MAG: GTPase Era [Firmicutes bacterium]|nr:GTPase Era [Bacillota bacterium]
MRSGFVGIIGRPNVGKSTLMNCIVGEKVSITTDKPQTTRNTIRGIYTRDGLQIVFIDTPCIHKAKNKLGQAMTQAAINTFKLVDALLFLVDGSPERGTGDTYIFNMIKDLDTPKFLVINKIDKMDPDEFKKTFDSYEALGVFDKVLGVSALTGKNVEELIDELAGVMEEGPMYFPEDMFADYPERFLVSEIIREKLLNYLAEEVPHGVAVEIEEYREEEGLTSIGAVIYCEKKSHKGIIIGREGRKLKGIGKAARTEIEGLLGTKVFLRLWVKIKENWRDSDVAIANFGYKDQE